MLKEGGLLKEEGGLRLFNLERLRLSCCKELTSIEEGREGEGGGKELTKGGTPTRGLKFTMLLGLKELGISMFLLLLEEKESLWSTTLFFWT